MMRRGPEDYLESANRRPPGIVRRPYVDRSWQEATTAWSLTIDSRFIEEDTEVTEVLDEAGREAAESSGVQAARE
jgi:hypothetical protein